MRQFELWDTDSGNMIGAYDDMYLAAIDVIVWTAMSDTESLSLGFPNGRTMSGKPLVRWAEAVKMLGEQGVL